MGVTFLRTGILCLLLPGLLATCDWLESIDTQAYRDYHASRWQAVVEAYVHEQPSVVMPAEPAIPRVCADTVDPAYYAIIDSAQAKHGAWLALRDQSESTVQFAAEMLSVLANRNTVSIELMTPQIDVYATEHEVLRQDWQDARQGIADAVGRLDTQWDTVWPGHDFGFDLLTDADQAKATLKPPPNDIRAKALTHYHDNEYSRLALIYLDYEPEVEPNPVSHVPKDCGELAAALARLEAALLVRFSMDEAIRADVDRVQDLALVDLSRTPWEEIKVPSGRYARPRVTASIARLKLLKYLDSLLTSCLDVLVHDVELEWQRVWPTHKLTVNIFSFAGLTEVSGLPDDPLVDLTFRE
jgi:hypothetical protein